MDQVWVPVLLFLVAAAFATVALAMGSEMFRNWWRRRQVVKRLEPVLSGRPGGGTRRPDVLDLVKEEQDESPGGIFSVIGIFIPQFRTVNILLEQARVNWSPWTFLFLTVGTGLGVGGTAYLLSRSILLAAVAAALSSTVPYLHLSQKRKNRFSRFEEEFPEAIDLLSRAIRAGHPLTSGIRMVADEGPPEVSLEFRRTFEEQRFGLPFEEALMGLVDRTDLVDVRIFTIAVMVQREVGGNLAEILDSLSATIRKRFFLRRQLRVYTAQGRMTGYALAALPIVLGSIIFLIQPEYMMLLFEGPGLFLTGAAIFLQVLGYLWIRKIIDIEI